jgi:hypothetical protein
MSQGFGPVSMPLFITEEEKYDGHRDAEKVDSSLSPDLDLPTGTHGRSPAFDLPRDQVAAITL